MYCSTYDFQSQGFWTRTLAGYFPIPHRDWEILRSGPTEACIQRIQHMQASMKRLEQYGCVWMLAFQIKAFLRVLKCFAEASSQFQIASQSDTLSVDFDSVKSACRRQAFGSAETMFLMCHPLCLTGWFATGWPLVAFHNKNCRKGQPTMEIHWIHGDAQHVQTNWWNQLVGLKVTDRKMKGCENMYRQDDCWLTYSVIDYSCTVCSFSMWTDWI